MTNQKNFDSGNPTDDDLNEDVDWLELEDEAFEDAEFEESSEKTTDVVPKKSGRAGNDAPKVKKKKSSLLFYLLTASILGAGGAGLLYMSGARPTTDTATPIVPINEPLAAEVQPQTPPEPEIAALPATDTSPVQPAAEPAATAGPTSPLTPMPDQVPNTAPVDLPPLELADEQAETVESQMKAPALPPAAEANPAGIATDAALIPSAPGAPILPPTESFAQPSDADQTLSIDEATLQMKTDLAPAAPPAPVAMPVDLQPAALAAAPADAPPVQNALPSPIVNIPPPAVAPQQNVALNQAPEPVIVAAAPAPEQPAAAIAEVAPVETTTEPVIAAPPPKVEPQPKIESKVAESVPIKDKPAPEKPKAQDKPSPKKESVDIPKKPAPKWVLRSAQPNMAVLYDPATGNMQTIEVGDRIEGLGRIRSISRDTGRWVISGSSGKVSQ